jgi:hypothetical protein
MSELSAKAFKNNDADIPRFCRNGKTYSRLQIDTFRVYVEKIKSNYLYRHDILLHHPLSGFLFKAKLPVSQMQMTKQHSSSWKCLKS